MVEGSHDETPPSPFADTDYPDGMRPNTAAVATLALFIEQKCGANGSLALLAALKIDQGKSADALGLLERERAERERTKREAAEARKSQQ